MRKKRSIKPPINKYFLVFAFLILAFLLIIGFTFFGKTKENIFRSMKFICIGTDCGGGSPYITIPNAPSNLVATAISTNQINLNWQDNSNNEDGFKIYRSYSIAGPYTLVATTRSNIISYSDTALESGTTYYYKIKSYNSAGGSVFSNIAYATTFQETPPITKVFQQGLDGYYGSEDAYMILFNPYTWKEFLGDEIYIELMADDERVIGDYLNCDEGYSCCYNCEGTGSCENPSCVPDGTCPINHYCCPDELLCGNMRPLIRFNDLGLAGTTVELCELQLYAYLLIGTNQVIQVHKVLRDWKEMEVTPYEYKSGESWSEYGAGINDIDVVLSPLTTITNPGGVADSWITIPLPNFLCQEWIDSPDGKNNGVLLWSPETGPGVIKDRSFRSKNWAGQGYSDIRPKLVITYRTS